MKIRERGITLIALVVTIVVLLILAGISIQMLTGQNGILKMAREAKEKTAAADVYEQIQLEVVGALDSTGKVNLEQAKKNIQSSLGLKDEDVTITGDNLIVDVGDKKLLVDQNGNITEWEDEVTKANAPKLTKGMIPVKYTGNTWVICSKDDPEWYNYDNQEWANIMLCDGTYDESTAVGTTVAEEDLGSMFVWIPRYGYKITKGYHQATNEPEIDVKFLKGTSYSYQDEKGNIYTVRNGNEPGVIDTTTGYNDYIVHPAFADGSKNDELSDGEREEYSNGEWKKEIEGIWVAKFKAGLATVEKDIAKKITIKYNSKGEIEDTQMYYPIFKGRKYVYNTICSSQAYELGLAMTKEKNPYGLNNQSNAHLIKNSEWGAVAYLSVSKYGEKNATNDSTFGNNVTIGGKKIRINEELYSNLIYAITGYSEGTRFSGTNEITFTGYNATDGVNQLFNDKFKDSSVIGNSISYAWNTVEKGTNEGNGTKASTTENITGIYDMVGCVCEHISAYVNYRVDNTDELLKYGKAFASGKSTYLSTAYPATAKQCATYGINESYDEYSKIFGDTGWETSNGIGSNNEWFEELYDYDESNETFFARALSWNTEEGMRII